jgi:hypothetical protein
MTTTLVKPSLFIHEMRVEQIGHLSLFKFSQPLQNRMEQLLDKKKIDELTSDETTELEAIGELDRIFTHMNAMLAAQNVNL